MKRIVALVFLFLLLMMSVTSCEQSDAGDNIVSQESDVSGNLSWENYYDLGVRYLSEGNYEEAIIAFEAAIEIDPKRADAYIGLADTYIATGNYETAKAVLEKAVEETNSESAKEMLAELNLHTAITPNFALASELTIDGTPFYLLSIDDARKAIGASNIQEYELEYEPYGTVYTCHNGGYSANSHINAASLATLQYDAGLAEYYGAETVETEIRDIALHETIDTVLGKLGFSKEGIQLFREHIEDEGFEIVSFEDEVLLSDNSQLLVDVLETVDTDWLCTLHIAWSFWPIDDTIGSIDMRLFFDAEERLTLLQLMYERQDAGSIIVG